MAAFSHVKISGFRRLANLDLPLRGLTVLIGANGVGKTSLLDVWTLLARSAEGQMRKTLNDWSGIAANITGGGPESMSFELQMPAGARKPLEYKLSLRPSGNTYEVASETLAQIHKENSPSFRFIQSAGGDIRYFPPNTRQLVRPTWEHDPLETSLAQIPKLYKEPERFRKTLCSATAYHALDVSPRAPVRLPQTMRPATLPGPDGEELISCLYSIRETDHDLFEDIEAALRAGFPSFERLDFPPVAAGTLAMTWKDRCFPKPFYMHQLSEGTLRYLWLVTLLNAPGLTDITLIDEPEVSLHPELLSLFVDLAREASQRTQVIIATHADALVRFLKPEEIVVMDIGDDGHASARWGDTMDLGKWLADYSLDEVWRMGRMGGRA